MDILKHIANISVRGQSGSQTHLVKRPSLCDLAASSGEKAFCVIFVCALDVTSFLLLSISSVLATL